MGIITAREREGRGKVESTAVLCGKKGRGFESLLGAFQRGICVFASCVCVGLLRVLQFCPTVLKSLGEVYVPAPPIPPVPPDISRLCNVWMDISGYE